MDLLRFTTAGSVDDGKSTLIGRLLYDSKSIFEDQLEAVERSSRSSGEETVNLALLTDGLRAEREQKITIDVAYRYFATPKRKFIIADTPGHEQYTRNMVTGASTADLAIILLDASKGVLLQSKRHAFISSLLRIPHLVVAVNKMDLVGYSQERFEQIVAEFNAFARTLDVADITPIPMSALEGDNVVERSERMPWYQGASLLHHLETVSVQGGDNQLDFRLPVQVVIRPNQTFRGFAGQIASGRIRPGDEVMILPSRVTSRVKEIVTADGPLEQAMSGDSVVLRLDSEVDVSRGDMIVRSANVPTVRSQVEAMLCWMHPEAMQPGKRYDLLHTTRTVGAMVEAVDYRIDVQSLGHEGASGREKANALGLNEIGRVRIRTTGPLFFDPYRINKRTGGFILIDPASNVTVAAGMIRAGSTTTGGARDSESTAHGAPSVPSASDSSVSAQNRNVVWEPWNVPRALREARFGQVASVVWFTGVSGAGKSTIARALEQRLWEQGRLTMLLDGDQLRHGLNADLGFSQRERAENVRRAGEVARLFFEHGNIVLCTFVSPFAADRARVRALFPEGRFLEVHVHCDAEIAERRDPKGLYAKARRGEMKGLTGIDGAYEAPEAPDLSIDTGAVSVEEAVDNVLSLLTR